MPDPWGRFTAPGELAATFRHFAGRRCGDYAPLYAHLGTRIAGDAELLAIAAHASPGQSPPDLMLAAVHYLLARQPHHPLARYYPTLTPGPDTGDAFPGFRAFCLDHRDELTRLVASRRVQTNEVRRCCYLLPALMAAGAMAAPRPLALIEAGASAGLNLSLDSYAYDYGTGNTIGDPGSPLLLRCRLDGDIQPPLGLPCPRSAGGPASTCIPSTRATPATPPGCGHWSGPTTPSAPSSSTAHYAPPLPGPQCPYTRETLLSGCPPSSPQHPSPRQWLSSTPRSWLTCPPWNGNASSIWSSCCPPPGLSTGSKPNPAATQPSPACA